MIQNLSSRQPIAAWEQKSVEQRPATCDSQQRLFPTLDRDYASHMRKKGNTATTVQGMFAAEADKRSAPLNRSLHAAKQDEFYTQYIDVQKEIEVYPEFAPDTFRNLARSPHRKRISAVE
jgi:hypothetical protein